MQAVISTTTVSVARESKDHNHSILVLALSLELRFSESLNNITSKFTETENHSLIDYLTIHWGLAQRVPLTCSMVNCFT